MMNPIEQLHQYQDAYTKSELQIYHYIIEKPYRIIRGTIDSVAKESHSSKSAIMRLCKKIGYKGFSEFKFELSRYIIAMEKKTSSEQTSAMTSVLECYAKHILAIENHVEASQLRQIAAIFLNSQRIKIFGYNRTSASSMHLRLRLAKLGYDCEAISDPVLMANQEDILDQNDLCILFTTTGESVLYKEIMTNLHEKKTKIVIFTMNPQCPLAPLANHIIYLPYISRSSYDTFLDDQAIFFVFIELFLNELANLSIERNKRQ